MALARVHLLRKQYHENITRKVLAERRGQVNIADRTNKASCRIARELASRLGGAKCKSSPSAQTAGRRFTHHTRDFLEDSLRVLEQIRPGSWSFSTEVPISEYEQYVHLADLDDMVRHIPELKTALGTDYLVRPDIVVYRMPISDAALGEGDEVVGRVATYTPLRQSNHPGNPIPLLHATVSCKWTMRSDRAQNTRTEALNLIRNRKGYTPHISAVTAEPLPTRIASLALGTGDLDCVYHFALYELEETLESLKNDKGGAASQLEMLRILIDGKRLRDISDLPFDLAI